jgi:hypothetical protein
LGYDQPARRPGLAAPHRFQYVRWQRRDARALHPLAAHGHADAHQHFHGYADHYTHTNPDADANRNATANRHADLNGDKGTIH